MGLEDASDKELMDAISSAIGTPRDISCKNNYEKANILALSFIGYVAKPVGISEEIYEKCVKAFQNCTAGKIEKEIEAIQQALDKEFPDEPKT